MDTLRNANYIFGVISEPDEGNPYRDDIFSIVNYFLNKLLTVRTTSLQKKFEGMFKNNTGCQNFFNKVNQYLKVYGEKVEKGVLKQFFAKMKYTDELSPKAYYVDKNLEKQIIELFRLLCKNGNTFMQNYLKKQSNNSRSFNMIMIVNEFTKGFLTHLHYPVAFDTFTTCLKCTLEFIQGPNKTNQNIIILNDFVSVVARELMQMKYHDNEKDMQSISDVIANAEGKNDSMTIKKSKSEFPSISVGRSALKKLSENNTTLPSTNYMISLAKFRVLLILNHLLDGFEPSDYVFYLYRREILPEMFRLNFAYQNYFFVKKYGSEYKTSLFFTYYENINKINKSPFLIEVGFECYFLLKKMEENLKLDYDERYQNNLMNLMPKWDKPQIKTSHNIFIESLSFFADIFKAMTFCCKQRSQEVVAKAIKNMANNDNVIRSILLFYENQSAQIEILKDGEIQEFWFPRLPYCAFRNSDAKDEFTDNVNRTNCKTK